MNKKVLLTLTILIMNIVAPLYAHASSLGEFKAAAILLAKALGWVFISIIIIIAGLLIYIKMSNKKTSYKPDYSENQKCEIDDTNNIDEAINSFLNINSK